jgi:hypothetical protein
MSHLFSSLVVEIFPMPTITVLKRAWEAWKSFGRRLGDFQARFILTIFYFVIIAPFSLLVRCLTDPLSLKRGTAKGWTVRSDSKRTELQRASEQF